MIEYIWLPIFGFILALQTVYRVRVITGSQTVAGVMGCVAFLFCFGMTGHLVFGCVLMLIILVLVVCKL